MCGQQLIHCRGRIRRICAAGTKERCLTTLLDLRAPGGDPAVVAPAKCIDEWLSIWQQRPDIRRSVRQ
eukprot:987477-Pyramimonas_sp.AAC.1